MEMQQRLERNNWGKCRPERDRSNSWQEGLTGRIYEIIQNYLLDMTSRKRVMTLKNNFSGVEVKSWLHQAEL